MSSLVFSRRKNIVPTKGSATQADNKRELKNLIAFFDDPPAALETFEPLHVRQPSLGASPRQCGQIARRRCSVQSGITLGTMVTPRLPTHARVSRATRKLAGTYVEDALFKRVHDKAGAGLQDAMDLAYLTGQRVTETRLMDERDMRDMQIWMLQGKTKAKRRIEITGELEILIDRIMLWKSEHKVRSTRPIVTEDGTPMTVAMLRRRFDLAREAAGVPKAELQMRGLHAKAGTDKAESSGDILHARDQPGHMTVVMTEQCIRNRKGKRVMPTK